MHTWIIKRHPPMSGLEEEWSVLERGEVVAACNTELTAQMLVAARYILKELAEADGTPLPQLVKDILRNNEGGHRAKHQR